MVRQGNPLRVPATSCGGLRLRCGGSPSWTSSFVAPPSPLCAQPPPSPLLVRCDAARSREGVLSAKKWCAGKQSPGVNRCTTICYTSSAGGHLRGGRVLDDWTLPSSYWGLRDLSSGRPGGSSPGRWWIAITGSLPASHSCRSPGVTPARPTPGGRRAPAGSSPTGVGTEPGRPRSQRDRGGSR